MPNSQDSKNISRESENVKLAKKIIYTEGKTPQETCQEIVDWIQG